MSQSIEESPVMLAKFIAVTVSWCANFHMFHVAWMDWIVLRQLKRASLVHFVGPGTTCEADGDVLVHVCMRLNLESCITTRVVFGPIVLC